MRVVRVIVLFCMHTVICMCIYEIKSMSTNYAYSLCFLCLLVFSGLIDIILGHCSSMSTLASAVCSLYCRVAVVPSR